jgi:F-type H+-transporting ATPase subunit alpha
LLERAAKLGPDRGGGSLTALPIAATEEGNLSGYIPTNLISITDGQIVLESRLFQEGQKPAVNVGKSVSRVGGKSQVTAMRQAAEALRLEYSQFLELEIFTRFGGMVDERTRRIIEHGRRIRAILTQPQFAPLPMPHQVALLLALNAGVLDNLEPEKVPALRDALNQWFQGNGSVVLKRLAASGEADEATRKSLAENVAKLAAELGATSGPSAARS